MWRMALARDMLRRGDGGVKEVAETVGYGSASSFQCCIHPVCRHTANTVRTPKGLTVG